MQWKPITDISDGWMVLADKQLPPLVSIWKDQADKLKESGAFQSYMQRLIREVAIETGVIERLYTLDKGVTRMLIERGIDEALIPHGSTDQPVKQVVALIRDQEHAVEGLFDFVGGQRHLSTSYVKELHQVLTRNQPTTEAEDQFGRIMTVQLRRGDWKLHPNNPTRPDGEVHFYAPPEQVSSEMDRLIAFHRHHTNIGVSPEVEAAWLHHRFTQIHPFQDGNGRVARCLASLVFIRAGWFPLVITRDDRGVYIDALESADGGDLAPLIELFSKSQRLSFIRSLSLSEQVLSRSRRAKTVIANIADKFGRKAETTQSRIETAEDYAKILHDVLTSRLIEVESEITLSLQNVVNQFNVFTSQAVAGSERSHYYRYQVIETAKQLDYFANLRNYHSWTQLVLEVDRPTMILFSFHELGSESIGLFVCSACAYHRDETENGERNVNEIQPLVDVPFQFSYADQQNNLIERFQKWMEDAIVAGLNYWNSSL